MLGWRANLAGIFYVKSWLLCLLVIATGTLRAVEEYLLRPDSRRQPVDTLGHLYVATRLAIQVCDQTARVFAIINPPNSDSLSGVTIGGSDLQDLYVVAGDKIFKRHILRKGVLPGVPEKPPAPHL